MPHLNWPGAAQVARIESTRWICDNVSVEITYLVTSLTAAEAADTTIAKHARELKRELDRLLSLKPTNSQGNHLRASMVVDAHDKLLVFLTRRDVEPTNNVSERGLRPSVIFRRVTNGFRSGWGAKVYADLCSIVATGRLAGRSPLASIRAAIA